MKIRSGLVEGLDIALHHRKPTDPVGLHDWLAQDLTPLNTALADIWTRWDQEGVRLANDVVSKSMDLMGASLARQPASTTRERLRRWAAGERWTPEMLADHDKALKKLAYARKELADHARGNLGLGPVDLLRRSQTRMPRPTWTAAHSRLRNLPRPSLKRWCPHPPTGTPRRRDSALSRVVVR